MSEKMDVSLPDTRLDVAKAESLLEKIASIKIKDNESYQYVAALLVEAKRKANGIEEKFAESVKLAHNAHKEILKLRDEVLEKFEEAEKLAKDKIAAYEGPKIEGILKSEKWRGRVIDESLIPRLYLIPNLKRLAEITESLKGETNIPGWEVSCDTTVSVRTQDIK